MGDPRELCQPSIAVLPVWIVTTAKAASKVLFANGRASAVARTTGAAPRGRCRIMTSDGSTAMTLRARGS